MHTRVCIASLLCVLILASLTPVAQAQMPAASSIHLSSVTLAAGRTETVTVTARDLAGNPLAGARGTAWVLYGTRKLTYLLPRTNAEGITRFSFRPPSGVRNTRAQIDISLSNGYLSVSLSSAFLVGTIAAPTHRGAAPKSPIRRSGTTRAASTGALKVVAQVVPGDVTAPAPVWVVVYAHTARGAESANTAVDVAVLFSQGVVHISSRTDSRGVATVRVSTSRVRLDQTVAVGVVAHTSSSVGSSATEFVVRRPASGAKPVSTSTPAPVPTAVPTSLPTPVPPPTQTPIPTIVSTPVITPTPTPTSTPVPTIPPTLAPTLPPLPTLIPTPLDTSTPLPTPTSADTPTPTDTPSPTPTATPYPNCPGSLQACMQAMVDIINQTRGEYDAKYHLGLGALTLNLTQSNGTGSCPGSMGHSQAMADSGSIWHQNPNYPQDSFPNNFCVQAMELGENVGVWPDGNELDALNSIHAAMMSEPWNPGCTTDHACNILSKNYTQVGIGIVQGTWNNYPAYYLTEDFIG